MFGVGDAGGMDGVLCGGFSGLVALGELGFEDVEWVHGGRCKKDGAHTLRYPMGSGF